MKNKKSLSTAHELLFSSQDSSLTMTHLMRKREAGQANMLHLQEFTAVGTKGWRGKDSQLGLGFRVTVRVRVMG